MGRVTRYGGAGGYFHSWPHSLQCHDLGRKGMSNKPIKVTNRMHRRRQPAPEVFL
jgi:hypothetical protein